VKHYWHILLWFLLSVAFCYLPFWFQRKFIFGAHVPLCLMAGISFDLILTRCFGPRKRRWAAVAAVVVLLPLLGSTQIHLLVGQSRKVKENADGAYYISNEVMEGLKFLKDNSNPNETVFATLATSRLIPAFSGNTVLWGHWAMSVDLKERKEWYANLFDQQANWDDERRGREFWAGGIQYIFADGAFKESLETSPQAWRVILKDADKVYANGSVVIYQHRDK
jgi:hypothetical protein